MLRKFPNRSGVLLKLGGLNSLRKENWHFVLSIVVLKVGVAAVHVPLKMFDAVADLAQSPEDQPRQLRRRPISGTLYMIMPRSDVYKARPLV